MWHVFHLSVPFCQSVGLSAAVVPVCRMENTDRRWEGCCCFGASIICSSLIQFDFGVCLKKLVPTCIHMLLHISSASSRCAGATWLILVSRQGVQVSLWDWADKNQMGTFPSLFPQQRSFRGCVAGDFTARWGRTAWAPSDYAEMWHTEPLKCGGLFVTTAELRFLLTFTNSIPMKSRMSKTILMRCCQRWIYFIRTWQPLFKSFTQHGQDINIKVKNVTSYCIFIQRNTVVSSVIFWFQWRGFFSPVFQYKVIG